MSKNIAILSNNPKRTLDWVALEKYKDELDKVYYNRFQARLLNGDKIYIVHDRMGTLGMHFDEMIVGPHYEDLRMLVQRRIDLSKD